MRVQCAPGYAIGMPVTTEETSIGGLVLGAVKDDFQRARLIVIGEMELVDGGIYLGFPFKEGDLVAYTGGMEIRIDGHTAVVLHRKNVVCALWEDNEEGDGGSDDISHGQLSLV